MVRFGQRQTRGFLLGLSGLRVAALGIAAGSFLFCLVTGGALGCAIAAPFWGLFAGIALLRFNGRPMMESLPVVADWCARSASGQTRYLVRPSAPRPAGTMALPGDAASLRCYVDPESGAAMVHDPHRNTISAVVSVTHPAYVLLSPDDRAARVSGWSRALAALAASGTVAAVQVLESTVPDPGVAMRSWWETHGVHDASWSARQYGELMEGRVGSSVHESLLALSVDLRRAAREVRESGRGMAGSAAVLRSAMAGFGSSLRAAGLHLSGWLGPDELAAVIRRAYDPGASARPGAGGRASRSGLDHAGPVAVEEHWDHLRHDSGFSSALWLSEWPRIDVPAHFLHALVFAPGIRRSLSILARPLSSSEALRQIRREKVEYLTDAAQKARIGQLADLTDEQQYADVLERERSLVAGHADLQFSGFVVVTAPSRTELSSSVAAIERAALQCGCETRLLYGQQAQAFAAAALPLARGVN